MALTKLSLVFNVSIGTLNSGVGTCSTTWLSAGHDCSVNNGDPDDAEASADTEDTEAWSLEDAADDEPEEHPAIANVKTKAAVIAISRFDIASSFP